MPKRITDIRSLARAHTSTAIRTLVSIMNDKEAAAAARVTAATCLLNRGWGMPKQDVDVTMRHVRAAELPDDILASIAAGGSYGDAASADDPSQLH